jgi:hypothetical protein
MSEISLKDLSIGKAGITMLEIEIQLDSKS